MFSILDVMWMMLCFYGMRRRVSTSTTQQNNTSTIQALIQGLTCQGISDSVSGGNAAIVLVAMTHLIASLVLAPNSGEDGCKISLPLLGGVVLWVMIILRRVMRKGNFLPEDQRLRIQGMQLGLRSVDQSHHVE